MSENLGKVKIADEVLANIVSTAVLEAEGVAGLGNQLDFSGRWLTKTTKGVNLSVQDEDVKISVSVMVKNGAKIQEVALDVQQKVKNAIEIMTGFNVCEVNVQVVGLVA